MGLFEKRWFVWVSQGLQKHCNSPGVPGTTWNSVGQNLRPLGWLKPLKHQRFECLSSSQVVPTRPIPVHYENQKFQIENPRVGGSIPPLGTTKLLKRLT